MKKITFYKNMSLCDVHGKVYEGYRIESSKGYLLECPNGVQFAIENNGSQWTSTEIMSGLSVVNNCGTRKEAIEKTCVVAAVVKKLLDKPNERILTAMNALKTYAEQQQRTVA